jgi:hypothetical protein
VNPLLHFYGNNQKFSIVVSGMWLNSTKERHCRVYQAPFLMCLGLYFSLTITLHNTHRIHCCFTKAIMLTETRHSMTLHIHSVPCVPRRKPAVVYNVAHRNNVYVRNMSGFDIIAKLSVLCFDGHYCNELITVLTKTTIEPNYDKCNQYKGIPVLYHQYVKYQSSVNHNQLVTTR